jgi:hypothetical protein
MSGEPRVGKDLEENGYYLIETLSRHLSGGTDEYHENSVRIACVSIEIRTEHLPNINLESYCYSTAPDKVCNKR